MHSLKLMKGSLCRLLPAAWLPLPMACCSSQNPRAACGILGVKAGAFLKLPFLVQLGGEAQAIKA